MPNTSRRRAMVLSFGGHSDETLNISCVLPITGATTRVRLQGRLSIMYSKVIAGSIITAAFLFAGAAASDQPAMPGEKLDSGLGALPPYGEWSKHPELAPLVAMETAPAVMTVARKSK